MYIVYNPTDCDVRHRIEYPPGNKADWSIKRGETLKFPNYVGEYLVKTYGFLNLLRKDDEKSSLDKKKEYKPPQDLDKVKQADFQLVKDVDRSLKHPTSEPGVVEFGGSIKTVNGRDSEIENDGLPMRIKEKLSNGKLLKLDADGVEWYGAGIEADDPLAKN